MRLCDWVKPEKSYYPRIAGKWNIKVKPSGKLGERRRAEKFYRSHSKKFKIPESLENKEAK
jgi:hypothetical protein